MVLAILSGIALTNSSILLWASAAMRLLLCSLFIIGAIRLNDRSIQKTLRRARAHWNPRYENYVENPAHQGITQWSTNIPKVQQRGNQSIYIAMGLLFVFALGMGSRQAMLLVATSRLDHVEVAEKISEKEFRFRTQDQSIVHGVFCDNMPFREGMKVSVKFESHLYCWSVRESGLSYFIEGDLNHGRNPDTYTNSNPLTHPVTYASR